MDKRYCEGCRNDFYNKGGVDGSTVECWHVDDATLVEKKKVHVSDVPPWDNNEIVKVPDCYSQPKYVFVDPDRVR